MSGRASFLDRFGRTVVGLLAASVAASVAAHLLFTTSSIATLPPIDWYFLTIVIQQMIFLAGIICVASALPAVVFLVLAALLKLKHWVWYSGFGAAVPVIIIAVLGSPSKDPALQQMIIWCAIVAGAVGGLVYWIIAERPLRRLAIDSA